MGRWFVFRRQFYSCLWSVIKEDKKTAFGYLGVFLFCLLVAICLTLGLYFDAFKEKSESAAMKIGCFGFYMVALWTFITYTKSVTKAARERLEEEQVYERVVYAPQNIPNIVIMGHDDDEDNNEDEDSSDSNPSGYASAEPGSISGASGSHSGASGSTSGTSGYLSAEPPCQVAASASVPDLSQSAPALSAIAPPLIESVPVLAASAPLFSQSAPVLSESVPPISQVAPILSESLPPLAQSVPDLSESVPPISHSVPVLTESLPSFTESVTVGAGSMTPAQNMLIEPLVIPNVSQVIPTAFESFVPAPSQQQIKDFELISDLPTLIDTTVFVYEELEVRRSQGNPEEFKEIPFPEEEGFKSIEEMQVRLIRRPIRSTMQEEQPDRPQDEVYRTNSSE